MTPTMAGLAIVAIWLLAACGSPPDAKRDRGAPAPVSTPARAAPAAPARPAAPPPVQRRISQPLLDAPIALTLPPGGAQVVARATQRFWWVAPYRHSRRAPGERSLDALVTFRTGTLEAWRRPAPPPAPGAAGPEAPPRVGAASVWAGPRKDWPKEIGVFETERALLLPSGASAQARVTVPAAGALVMTLGLVPAAGRRPVTLVVAAIGPGVTPPLLTLSLDARAAGAWRRVQVPLDALAGRTVDLTFTVATVGGADAEAVGVLALGQPRLEGLRGAPAANLVVIILDTARKDTLGCYGQQRVLTPGLDALARAGARFDEAFANATWTRPSIMSLLSSRTAGAAGSTPVGFFVDEVDRRYYQGADVPTLLSHAEAAGYVVRGLVNNFFMWPHERIGHDHGIPSFANLAVGDGPGRQDNHAITEAAERFLAEHRGHRFALYVHYESPHSPYAPPTAVLDRLRAHLGKEPLRFEDRYRAEVMALDDEVGRIWKALERLGLRGETVVLVTADHGEVLDRRHCFFLPRLKYNTCYSHSTSPYDEVLRVPLLLAGAGVPAGKVVTQITRHVDLVPTVLTLMGVPPLPGAMGVSVLPQVRGERPDEARDVYAAGRGIYALRRGTWKIIYRDAATRDIVDGGRKRSVTMELYDLAADPAEHRNLAGTEKVRTEAMFRELLGYMAKDRVVLPPYLKKKLSESR